MFNLWQKRPSLSVVVVIYNKENYIEDCLDSILNQNIDMEILCIDDCSTDKTYDLLQQYQQKNKNIKIIRNTENRGTCYTRYVGLKECRGDYMMFVDGDDTVPPNCLSEIIKYGQKMKTDIIEFNTQLNNETLMYTITPQLIKKELLAAHNKRIIKNVLWNKMFSRKTYLAALKTINIDIPHDDFSDVLYFLINFLHHANHVAQTDLVGYNYYSKRGMTHSSSHEERLAHYCNFGCTYTDLCGVYGETEELFHWKNYLCNQAIETYLALDHAKRKSLYTELTKMMNDDEIKFLISEKKNTNK